MAALFYEGLVRLHVPQKPQPNLLLWAGLHDAINASEAVFLAETFLTAMEELPVGGYFDPGSNTVINATYDVSVLFHEYGHMLLKEKVVNRSGKLDGETAANMVMAGIMHALNVPLHPGFHLLSNTTVSRIAYAVARYRCGGRLDTCNIFWKALQEGDPWFFSILNILSQPLRNKKKTDRLLNNYLNKP